MSRAIWRTESGVICTLVLRAPGLISIRCAAIQIYQLVRSSVGSLGYVPRENRLQLADHAEFVFIAESALKLVGQSSYLSFEPLLKCAWYF